MRWSKSKFNQSGIFVLFYNQTHFLHTKLHTKTPVLILNNAKSLF
ncbi:hypothetical protein HMPREF1437_01238 [Helicobacter pylori HP116Bi]|nr:hypothetical protein HMPREF1437_01238 [Helicobacter pylori HP116Bi]